MTTVSKVYQIGKIKQLIDLNGDSTNFQADFHVFSKDKQPFELTVTDQTSLDNDPVIKYQEVKNGDISGSISHDKNVYQNYFLVLKSESPCTCTVEITKKEIPKAVPQLPVQSLEPVRSKETKSTSLSWTKLLIFVGLILAFGFGLYYYSKKSNPEVKMAMSRSRSHSNDIQPNRLLERLKSLNLS
jgi:hypothetical protein